VTSYNKVLSIKEITYGKFHAETAPIYYIIGVIYQKQGKLKEAMQEFNRVL
jgi:hypothetical protein